MLVLKRRPGEKIVIGDGPSAVVVKVVRVDGSSVRLAIDAAEHVQIRRWELEPKQRPEVRDQRPECGRQDADDCATMSEPAEDGASTGPNQNAP